jgi:quinol monooxygenase YgiN
MIMAALGIRVMPENKGQALQVVLPLLGPTRAESGCVGCDLYQSAENPMKLILMEQWESLTDLQRHIRSDHYRHVLAWVEMSVEPPEIRFDVVSESRGIEIIELARG